MTAMKHNRHTLLHNSHSCVFPVMTKKGSLESHYLLIRSNGATSNLPFVYSEHCRGVSTVQKVCGQWGRKISARAFGARNILPILHALKIMVLKHPKNNSCAKNKFSGKSKKIMYPRKCYKGANECILRAPLDRKKLPFCYIFKYIS